MIWTTPSYAWYLGEYGEWDQCNVITVDAASLALELLKRPVTNTMFGALVGASDIISLDSKFSSVKGFLLKQGRFKHLKDEDIETITRYRDKDWDRFRKNCGY